MRSGQHLRFSRQRPSRRLEAENKSEIRGGCAAGDYRAVSNRAVMMPIEL
jgi:hypothetical protein